MKLFSIVNLLHFLRLSKFVSALSMSVRILIWFLWCVLYWCGADDANWTVTIELFEYWCLIRTRWNKPNPRSILSAYSYRQTAYMQSWFSFEIVQISLWCNCFVPIWSLSAVAIIFLADLAAKLIEKTKKFTSKPIQWTHLISHHKNFWTV